MDIRETVIKLNQGGITLEEAQRIVRALATTDHWNLKFALEQTEIIYKANPASRSLSQEVNEYVLSTSGYFSSTDVEKCLQLSTRNDKKNLSAILSRLLQTNPPVIERYGNKTGVFRRIEMDAPAIEWQAADISATVSLLWPFELENYALIYPKNLAVIAGAPNAGKTALLLNVIKLNQFDFTIHYYSSEMGPEEMKLRLSKFDDVESWTFDARERSMNFADVIYPDDINIIDYIEITSGEFYRIAEELRAIFDKLNKGIAIIALQKKKGAELGRGAEFSLEKPRLYLSMDSGTLKIIKAKNWAVEGENPNGVEFNFKLINGARFIY